MKIFQSIQQNFAVLGITMNQSRQQSPINMKHLMIFSVLSAAICSQIVCMITLAQNFEEYTNCIYGAFTLVTIVIELGMHIWKMKPLFQYIRNFEHFIEPS